MTNVHIMCILDGKFSQTKSCGSSVFIWDGYDLKSQNYIGQFAENWVPYFGRWISRIRKSNIVSRFINTVAWFYDGIH